MKNKITFLGLIKENKFFFISYIAFLIIAGIILLNIKKGDAVIFFNDMRGSYDGFFIFLSDLGEGLLFGIFLIIIGLFRLKYLILGVASFLISGAVTQILKNIFLVPRPKVFFAGTDLVTFVNDVVLLSGKAFPSGHTTSGFAIFLFLALITPNKKIGVIFLFGAVLVGTSRIYLVQHFFVDVYFGSVIGVVFTLLTFMIFENSQKITRTNWYNYSIIKKIKR